jgi:hypothetical protein
VCLSGPEPTDKDLDNYIGSLLPEELMSVLQQGEFLLHEKVRVALRIKGTDGPQVDELNVSHSPLPRLTMEIKPVKYFGTSITPQDAVQQTQ